jgi:hypothetical protein
MRPATDTPIFRGPPSLSETTGTAEAVAALRQQLAVLDEQLAAVNRQQAVLRAALDQLLARFPEAGHGAEASAQPLLQRCAGDVLRVLGEVGRPLGTLELLEEMATRHLSWRESTVRHVLADLKNEGIVREGDGQRPLSYSLPKQTQNHP